MKMKKIAVFAGLAIVTFIASRQGMSLRAVTADETIASNVESTWVVISKQFREKRDDRFNNAILKIDEDVGAEFVTVNGDRVGISFQDPIVGFSRNEITRLFLETSEDKPEFGGGGPRKAIGQIMENGSLEVLVARSASRDFPADFGPEASNDSIRWVFSPLD